MDSKEKHQEGERGKEKWAESQERTLPCRERASSQLVARGQEKSGPKEPATLRIKNKLGFREVWESWTFEETSWSQTEAGKRGNRAGMEGNPLRHFLTVLLVILPSWFPLLSDTLRLSAIFYDHSCPTSANSDYKTEIPHIFLLRLEQVLLRTWQEEGFTSFWMQVPHLQGQAPSIQLDVYKSFRECSFLTQRFLGLRAKASVLAWLWLILHICHPSLILLSKTQDLSLWPESSALHPLNG